MKLLMRSGLLVIQCLLIHLIQARPDTKDASGPSGLKLQNGYERVFIQVRTWDYQFTQIIN